MRPIAKILVLAAAGAYCLPASAAGTVNVKFENPEHFQDASRDYPMHTDKRVLEAIESYLKEQATPLLDEDQTLDITVTQVDLAGEFRPYTASQQWVRTMTEVSWPRMTLEYRLSEGGEPGPVHKAELADMSYRQRIHEVQDEEPLYYDKRMLREWIRKTFGAW